MMVKDIRPGEDHSPVVSPNVGRHLLLQGQRRHPRLRAVEERRDRGGHGHGVGPEPWEGGFGSSIHRCRWGIGPVHREDPLYRAGAVERLGWASWLNNRNNSQFRQEGNDR